MMDAVNLAWKLAAVIGGWAPAGLLDTYHHERHFAGARGLLQTQAQVALRRGQDPAAEALREVFSELLVDALLIRPDAYIAWAANIDEPADTATLMLREALSCWFGTPLKRQCRSSIGSPDQPTEHRSW
jgi:FAD binding domain